MMMTQSYYGGEFDSFSRSSHRAPISAGHYERAVPYSLWEPQHHQDLRAEYLGRSGSRTLIQEHGPENGNLGQSRRRIQVACSRCRRRKIKCTGDPGDGSGCSACKSAGADRHSCTFNRVGSQQMAVAVVDMLPSNSSISSATPTSSSYPPDTSSSSYGSSLYQTQHRPSLPMLQTLQTRTAYPEYDSYNTSPVDDYTYGSSSMPRHESFSSTYGTESFRPYTTGSLSTPSTSASLYYEPGAAFIFGSLQAAPGYTATTPASRLPSVTAEAFSPLNMTSLHSSLPTQTAQERRLPVPYTQQQPAYTAADIPQIRPLQTFTEAQPRAHISGIHSRNGMSWTGESPASRTSVSTMQNVAHGLPHSSSEQATSYSTAQPAFGYQFSASSGSPETSPTTGPALSESFSSTSGSSTAGSTTGSSMMPPSSTVRYSMSAGLPNVRALSNAEEYRRPSSSHETAASLYSFSTGIDTSGRSTPARHASQQLTDEKYDTSNIGHHSSYPQVRHPQPQHAASVDELRRRSSYDQQQRNATAHRMSVSNLNARY